MMLTCGCKLDDTTFKHIEYCADHTTQLQSTPVDNTLAETETVEYTVSKLRLYPSINTLPQPETLRANQELFPTPVHIPTRVAVDVVSAVMTDKQFQKLESSRIDLSAVIKESSKLSVEEEIYKGFFENDTRSVSTLTDEQLNEWINKQIQVQAEAQVTIRRARIAQQVGEKEAVKRHPKIKVPAGLGKDSVVSEPKQKLTKKEKLLKDLSDAGMTFADWFGPEPPSIK